MKKKILPLILLAIILCGCIQTPANNKNNCTDGTIQNSCSEKKPFFCDNGTLTENSQICGCDSNSRLIKNECISINDCKDKTKNLECSKNKPLQCINGSLVEKASHCGCPVTKEPKNDSCIDAKNGSQTITLNYTLRGQSESIQFAVYQDLAKKLAELPRTYVCDPDCPTKKELELSFLNEKEQSEQLKKLTEIIKKRTENPADQARIAISIVQNIPYDWERFNKRDMNIKYPYEVLFENKGICAGKSRLLIFFLREFGFGSAFIEYNDQNHEAVGIKCPIEYSINNSGYCFIEATSTSLITDSNGNYTLTGTLDPNPEIVTINDGISFDSVVEETTDLKTLNQLEEIAKSKGNALPPKEYNQWKDIVRKYGLKTEK